MILLTTPQVNMPLLFKQAHSFLPEQVWRFWSLSSPQFRVSLVQAERRWHLLNSQDYRAHGLKVQLFYLHNVRCMLRNMTTYDTPLILQERYPTEKMP